MNLNNELEFLKETNFDAYLKKIIKKSNNKPVVVYGAGALFKVINENYDLSGLNIIALADKKYEMDNCIEEFPQFNKISPEKIFSYNPYVILLATLKPAKVLMYLYEDLLVDNAKIKVDFLFKKNKFDLIKEIWQES